VDGFAGDDGEIPPLIYAAPGKAGVNHKCKSNQVITKDIDTTLVVSRVIRSDLRVFHYAELRAYTGNSSKPIVNKG
jgi:hypothetical protein